MESVRYEEIIITRERTILGEEVIQMLGSSSNKARARAIVRKATEDRLGFQPRSFMITLSIFNYYQRVNSYYKRFMFNLLRCLYKDSIRISTSSFNRRGQRSATASPNRGVSNWNAIRIQKATVLARILNKVKQTKKQHAFSCLRSYSKNIKARNVEELIEKKRFLLQQRVFQAWSKYRIVYRLMRTTALKSMSRISKQHLQTVFESFSEKILGREKFLITRKARKRGRYSHRRKKRVRSPAVQWNGRKLPRLLKRTQALDSEDEGVSGYYSDSMNSSSQKRHPRSQTVKSSIGHRKFQIFSNKMLPVLTNVVKKKVSYIFQRLIGKNEANQQIQKCIERIATIVSRRPKKMYTIPGMKAAVNCFHNAVFRIRYRLCQESFERLKIKRGVHREEEFGQVGTFRTQSTVRNKQQVLISHSIKKSGIQTNTQTYQYRDFKQSTDSFQFAQSNTSKISSQKQMKNRIPKWKPKRQEKMQNRAFKNTYSAPKGLTLFQIRFNSLRKVIYTRIASVFFRIRTYQCQSSRYFFQKRRLSTLTGLLARRVFGQAWNCIYLKCSSSVRSKKYYAFQRVLTSSWLRQVSSVIKVWRKAFFQFSFGETPVSSIAVCQSRYSSWAEHVKHVLSLPYPKDIHDYIDDIIEVSKGEIEVSYKRDHSEVVDVAFNVFSSRYKSWIN